MFERYAIYYTPDGALGDFGAAWLGWDIAAGCARAVPEGFETLDVEAITRTPRRYGFHATIKPPFRMRPGRDAGALRAAFARLCRDLVPAAADGLEVTAIGEFLALTPVGDTGALDALAAEVVTALDGFRAPPSPDELERRRAAGLSPEQERLLGAWGYPYVMGEFRFHITLSGALDDGRRAQVRRDLAPRIAPRLPSPFRIDTLTLAGEDARGNFHAVDRLRLAG